MNARCLWLVLVVACKPEDEAPTDANGQDDQTGDTGGDTVPPDTDPPDTDPPDTDVPAAIGPIAGPAYGATLGEWGGRWWNWSYSINADAHPILDTTTECDVNQPLDMFFLGGTYGWDAVRTCTIPAGRPIFFPIDTVEYDNYPSYSYTADEFAEWAQAAVDGALSRTLEIDGVVWDNDDLQAFRDAPHTFVLTVPDITPNLMDWLGAGHFAGDLDPAVTDGMWIMLDPLPPGEHHVFFEADYGSFRLSADYTLTVE